MCHDEVNEAGCARPSTERAASELPYRVTSLLCKRTGQRLPLAEHEACPYCFGKKDEVATGLHSHFCGYQPERDPVHFGFPGGTARDLEG
ncbi:MAG: hypothetical protein U1F29_18335 [Planctomycetota bacterium]